MFSDPQGQNLFYQNTYLLEKYQLHIEIKISVVSFLKIHPDKVPLGINPI